MLIFFDSNAQVTFSITNASSVNANDGQVVASVNPGSGNYTFYWEDLSTNLPGYGTTSTTATAYTFFNAPSGTYLLTFIDVGLSTFSNDTIFISAPGQALPTVPGNFDQDSASTTVPPPSVAA